jgi:RNA polymerase sigma factor (sigma-70 family)
MTRSATLIQEEHTDYKRSGTRETVSHSMRPFLEDKVAPATPGSPASHAAPVSLDRDTLYAEFAPLVRRLIRQYGSDDAELRADLSGEIYCRFCALLDAYDPERGIPLRPYLVRQLTASVYTYARQNWRRQRREVYLEISEGTPEPVQPHDPTRGWNHAMAMQQVLTALPQGIAQLPQRQRQVVFWRYYEHRSFEEIAQTLDIRVASARSLLRHGLNNLRKWITEHDLDWE